MLTPGALPVNKLRIYLKASAIRSSRLNLFYKKTVQRDEGFEASRANEGTYGVDKKEHR
jgi:hypothetical protein